MTPPEDSYYTSINDKIYKIAEAMKYLSTGDMASLKRGPMKKGEVGAPVFWLYSARYDFPDDEDWAAILQAMALLAVGSEDGKGFKNPHDKNYSFGRALCEGGDKGWGGGVDARPVLSELRLARLLNAKGEHRRDMLLRVVRLIARVKTPVNCMDIAWLILQPDGDWAVRSIARDYYRRFSSAERENAIKTA